MTLQEALQRSHYEMAIRTLPTGETVIGYRNGVGLVIGPEQLDRLRAPTKSREATQEELDTLAAWAPV